MEACVHVRGIPDHKAERASKRPTCLLMGNPTEKTQICIIWLGLRLPLNARSKFSEALCGTKAPLSSHPANQFPATGKETSWQQARVQGVSVKCKGDHPGGPSWRPRSLSEAMGVPELTRPYRNTPWRTLPLSQPSLLAALDKNPPEASKLLSSQMSILHTGSHSDEGEPGPIVMASTQK